MKTKRLKAGWDDNYLKDTLTVYPQAVSYLLS